MNERRRTPLLGPLALAAASAIGVAGAALVAGDASAAPPPKRPGSQPGSRAGAAASRPAPVMPVAPLAMLPSIPRVRIEVLKSQLVVIEEINLPRGEWNNEALDFYVAFGAPGAPRAVDAKLVAVGDGSLEPEDDDSGEPLVVDRAAHRPASAHPLLGRDSMAGVVVHVKRESLARALAPGNMAALRIRTALDLPEEDSGGAHGVVVRLGASRGTPLTLGRLALIARPGAAVLARAEAQLCGSEADAAPLAIAIVPRPPPSASPAPLGTAADAAAPASPPIAPIAPVLAVRHATDDLCVRFWTQP